MAVNNAGRGLIAGPAGQLEAAWQDVAASAPGDYAAVICHPHPLHGGTMDNKVVVTLARAFAELEIPAVRFNFRGTGASEGAHDDGRGEVDDLAAVAAWMGARHPGARLVLAGFSFGAGVAGNGAQRLAEVAHLVLVAPPVGRYGFSEQRTFPCPWTLVMGGRDEVVDPAEVRRWAGTMAPPPTWLDLPEAGHFFHGQLIQLRQGLVAILRARLREG
jgi:alpha/beta superfamily hydrolase